MGNIDEKALDAAARHFNNTVEILLRAGWTQAEESANRWYWWKHPAREGGIRCTIGVAYQTTLRWEEQRAGRELPEPADRHGRLGQDGSVRLPPAVVERTGLRPGDFVYFADDEKGIRILTGEQMDQTLSGPPALTTKVSEDRLASETSARLWVQEWEESERGWGVRPDGYTLHVQMEDIAEFVSDMRHREAEIYKGAVPDEYSRPIGKPYVAAIDDAKLIAEVRASKNGIWGPGRTAPPKANP